LACVDHPPANTAPTTTEPPPPIVLRSESMERAARSYTVRVRNRSCEGVGTGSAVLLEEDLLVTNAHVVVGALELGIDTWDGRSTAVAVARTATLADLAIVELVSPVGEPAELSTRRVREGDLVTAAGYPQGGEITFSEGEAVDYHVDRRLGTTEAVLRFEAEVRPGNSGGPLVDADGKVVGVVFGLELDTDLGLAVPVDVIEETLANGELQPVRPCLD